jgi:shikimate kinase
MATGKTTLGRTLAERLGREFRDSDDLVASLGGRAIGDFFEAGEEAEFRRLEAQAVGELASLGEVVIALGGGALLRPETARLLRRTTLLVHLQVPWTVLGPRLAKLRESRPLLRGRSLAQIRRLYRSRLDVYRLAPIQVPVGRRGVDAAVDQVLQALLNKEHAR